MESLVGKALAGFEEALARLHDALAGDRVLHDAVFLDSAQWEDLLRYKLVPHLAGDGCLVAVVCGGTNSGKSTVFNLLLGASVSPIVNTAAATSHPVLAASEMRHGQCLEAKLVPEFAPEPLVRPELVTDSNLSDDILFVFLDPGLPDHLVLMDTPDIDSIEKQNWEVAKHIRAAGDILIAVITAEKYKDERVVRFFREALASGRMVVPLMNKANPADDYAVARKQLEDFRADVGTPDPCFVIPHDFNIAKSLDRPVQSLEEGPGLREYLEGRDVPAIKEQVYKGTVQRFAQNATAFLQHVEETASALQSVENDFQDRARNAAALYDPVPGKDVGGLFHEFVQSHRGPVRRYIGAGSSAVARRIASVGRALTGALRRRATLEADEKNDDAAMLEQHRGAIERITQGLAREFIDVARHLREPAAHLVAECAADLDVDAVVQAVTEQAIQSDNLSDEFKQHAETMLQNWWDDHKGRRRVLEALDSILAVVPAAIAAPIAMHTGGAGVSEAIVFVGPVAEQFVARVIEYQFGDAMFDFLSPWKKEQQDKLYEALAEHVLRPVLQNLQPMLESLQGETIDQLQRCCEQCHKA